MYVRRLKSDIGSSERSAFIVSLGASDFDMQGDLTNLLNPPRRKRSRVGLASGPASSGQVSAWQQGEEAQAAQQRREAGAELLKHLLGLFSVCKLSAKDFTTACYLCARAGTPGADFEAYAVPPKPVFDRRIPTPS